MTSPDLTSLSLSTVSVRRPPILSAPRTGIEWLCELVDDDADETGRIDG